MRWEEREARKAAVDTDYRAGLKVAEICERNGCSNVFVYATLKEKGTPRRAALPKLLAAGAIGGPEGRPAPGLDGRLERLLSDRIADLERRTALGQAGDPEAVARALALNVRTLATLRRVEVRSDDDPSNEPDAPPARSLSQLRDELLGHLHALQLEARARRRAATPRPDGA